MKAVICDRCGKTVQACATFSMSEVLSVEPSNAGIGTGSKQVEYTTKDICASCRSDIMRFVNEKPAEAR